MFFVKNIRFCILIILAVQLAGLLACQPVSVAEDKYAQQRLEMVEGQIAGRGVKNPEVLDAMRAVPRHLFVPVEYKDYGYWDRPLPIGYGQTISQPYIVALMTELLGVNGDSVALEVGTGSGYQAAVLSKIVKQVYTIEIIKELGKQAKKRLEEMKYSNVEVRVGDGY
jgi:protein-L-isoaspartate(D-aspartate) O-methyltransferase